MGKKLKTPGSDTVPADSIQWSEKSKRSYSFGLKNYKDIKFNCSNCGKPSTFTAKDQKYTYEVRKAHISQQRVLCKDCWKELLLLNKKLEEKDKYWKENKAELKSDLKFLTDWLQILELHDKFYPYSSDIAKKNMLKKLLDNAKT